MVIDATPYSHLLRWHPMTFREGPPTAAGDRATAIPTWGEPDHAPNAALPAPIGPAARGVAHPAGLAGGRVDSHLAAMEKTGYEYAAGCPGRSSRTTRGGRSCSPRS